MTNLLPFLLGILIGMLLMLKLIVYRLKKEIK